MLGMNRDSCMKLAYVGINKVRVKIFVLITGLPRERNCGSRYEPPFYGHRVPLQNEDLEPSGLKFSLSLRGKGIRRAPHGGVPQIVTRHIPCPRAPLRT